ncbi:N-acetylmuramoyl-L-alanine amidase [Glycomyces rhizosphaerae]|uniref:N-acetylmuramoyl-L-alanine amidase n=1 Tax=Glycomyces rhizosphaerae TaxID=2054422 RepID=A0ABV7Q4F7_9ACTN
MAHNLPRWRRRHRAVAAGAAALAAAAKLGAVAWNAAAEEPAGSPRQAEYTAAAAEYEVPEAILLGVSYMQSRWTDHGGQPSTAGGFGPMHLTDEVPTLNGAGHHNEDDARGDDTRPMELPEAESEAPEADPGPITIDDAASLTGETEEELRTDPASNIAGGAALLADYAADLGIESDDPADWYAAVARYSGAEDEATAARFADEVYALIATGATEETDDGTVTLDSQAVDPDESGMAALGLTAADTSNTICPDSLGCEWIPAPYEQWGTTISQYGNHDLADRENDIDINAIVIHDTEGCYDGTLDVVQDPARISWNYTVRSSDGHIAEHLDHKNVGWQAGNWAVNMRSLGIEHEGFAADGSWYTEILYRNSAELVGFLADRYDVPIDRAHILGHDNVPQSTHWDPGPYWDWGHYFQLLGVPLEHASGGIGTEVVTVAPEFADNRPVMTGCDAADDAAECPVRGASTVFLYSEPSLDAPLLNEASNSVDDLGARAGYGQQFAVAEVQGDWVAVWYQGKKGWILNHEDSPVLAPARGQVAVPNRDDVTVWRDTFPEAAAYEGTGATYRPNGVVTTIDTGQSYVVGQELRSQALWAKTYNTPTFVVNGETVFYQIQIGHRIGYVDAADVTLEMV